MRSVALLPIRSTLLAVCIWAPLFLLAAAGCSRRESSTVQVDVSNALSISGKARSSGDGPLVCPSQIGRAHV